jgi:hypothetical protein
VDAVGSVGHLRQRLLQAHERLDLKPGTADAEAPTLRVCPGRDAAFDWTAPQVHLAAEEPAALTVQSRAAKCTNAFLTTRSGDVEHRATGLRGLLLRCRTVPIVLLIDAFRQQDGIRQLHAFSDCRSVRACGVWTRAAWE